MKRNKNDFNFSLSNVFDEETEMFPLMSNEDEEQINKELTPNDLKNMYTFYFIYKNMSERRVMQSKNTSFAFLKRILFFYICYANLLNSVELRNALNYLSLILFSSYFFIL